MIKSNQTDLKENENTIWTVGLSTLKVVSQIVSEHITYRLTFTTYITYRPTFTTLFLLMKIHVTTYAIIDHVHLPQIRCEFEKKPYQMYARLWDLTKPTNPTVYPALYIEEYVLTQLLYHFYDCKIYIFANIFTLKTVT